MNFDFETDYEERRIFLCLLKNYVTQALAGCSKSHDFLFEKENYETLEKLCELAGINVDHLLRKISKRFEFLTPKEKK